MMETDQPSKCADLREDYFECLHHRKEVSFPFFFPAARILQHRDSSDNRFLPTQTPGVDTRAPPLRPRPLFSFSHRSAASTE